MLKKLPFKKTLASLFLVGVLTVAGMSAFSSSTRGDRETLIPVQHYQDIFLRTSESGQFRVMTLNLAHGRLDGSNQLFVDNALFPDNLKTVADVIIREAVDVVALQEVDKPSFWSGYINMVDHIAVSAGFPFAAHGEHVKGLNLAYGTAVLSRHEMNEPASITFPPALPSPSKGFVVSTIRLPNSLEVDVVSVHLDFTRDSVRKTQVNEMTRYLSGRNRPLIIMGDFNSQWHDDYSAVKVLAEQLNLQAWRPEDASISTYPTLINLRLDWILASPELEHLDCRVLPDVISDHRAVVCDLQTNTRA